MGAFRQNFHYLLVNLLYVLEILWYDRPQFMWMTLAWGQIKNARYFWIDVKTSPTYSYSTRRTHSHARGTPHAAGGNYYINYNSPSAYTHDYYIFLWTYSKNQSFGLLQRFIFILKFYDPSGMYFQIQHCYWIMS